MTQEYGGPGAGGRNYPGGGYPGGGYPGGGYPGGQGYPAQPGYQPQPPQVGAGLVGKRRNPFAVWIGLPIITLGIYGFVWIYKTNKELNRFDQRIKVNPWLSVLAFFPGALLFYIPPLVAAWRLANRVRDAQRAAMVPEASPALALVLWILVLGTGTLYLQYEINKIWDHYPGAVEDQEVPLYV
jgi:Domain of unknown function (DUF4234)